MKCAVAHFSLPDRLMVGHIPLEDGILVRVQVRQLDTVSSDTIVLGLYGISVSALTRKTEAGHPLGRRVGVESTEYFRNAKHDKMLSNS